MLIPREPTEFVEWGAASARKGLCPELTFTEADETVFRREGWLHGWFVEPTPFQ